MARSLRAIEATCVLLFLLQALRAIFSVMFGVIYDQVFAGPMDAWLAISNLLVLAALLLPALAPRVPGRTFLASLAALAAMGRIGLSINEAGVRFWAALLVISAAGLYLACLLGMARPLVLGSLMAALVLDQLLRALGTTYDISLRPGWLPVQVVWSALVILLSALIARRSAPFERADGVPGAAWGLAFGGFLFLEASLLSLPNAMARWSGAPYPAIAALLLAISFLPLLPGVRQSVWRSLIRSRPARLAASALLVVCLLLGYFSAGFSAALSLLAAQALALAGLVCLLDGLPDGAGSPAGKPLALGMAFFLVLNFFNAFAFTYPYVLPFMRGLGWAVYLVAGLAFGLGLAAGGATGRQPEELFLRPAWAFWAGGIALVAVLAAAWPPWVEAMPEDGRLRAATYNIHYGYDTVWHFTLEETARAIQASEADIVALQEVDTGRLTSYGVDNALYLARRLRMNAVYLPTVEHLTGIALLHKGPAVRQDSRLVTSLQEQTGIVHARLQPGGRPLDAYAIWLGLSDEDTQTQIEEALAFIGPASPAVFGGDFNAEPDSPVVQSIRQAGFVDPFLALGFDPPPLTDPTIDPVKRIDYVWLRGLAPRQAWVSDALASDHRMVVVEVQIE